MSHIVLTPEQARIVAEASGPIEVRTPQGEVLARILSPADARLIAENRGRLDAGGPRYPAADVEARLRRLEEISRQEALDETRVRELLRRMRAGETV